MVLFIKIALFILAGAVVLSLGVGVISFVIGGDFNRRHSNTLMRIRVGAQALVVFTLLAIALAHLNNP